MRSKYLFSVNTALSLPLLLLPNLPATIRTEVECDRQANVPAAVELDLTRIRETGCVCVANAEEPAFALIAGADFCAPGQSCL